MGCVHSKCRSRYPSSTDSNSGDYGEMVSSWNATRKHILTQRSLEIVPVPSHNYELQYSVLTQRGYYPDSPDKENQDSFCIRTPMQGNPNVHFFGVFDGHGDFGTECSRFVEDRLVEILANDPTLLDDPIKAYNSAFLTTNYELHSSEIDDSMSGTTAITALVIGDTIYVANVGDSRAVIAVKNENRIVAEALSIDQTPFRKDEYERVKLSGATVLTTDQLEGHEDPNIQFWGDEESHEGGPPRLWVLQNGLYTGTAFTRSVGDGAAETIGVISVPEVSIVRLTPNHLFFVVASDGVFEFLSSQTVVDMAARYTDPRDACAAIAGESYRIWLEHETRTDDITIIIIHINGLSDSGAGGTDGTTRANRNLASSRTGRGSSDSSTTCGSEIYRSIRSKFTDLQVSMRRSPAIVVPSPSIKKPLELDGG